MRRALSVGGGGGGKCTTKDGKGDCVLPTVYEGTTYPKCTGTANNGKLWCYTQSDKKAWGRAQTRCSYGQNSYGLHMVVAYAVMAWRYTQSEKKAWGAYSV